MGEEEVVRSWGQRTQAAEQSVRQWCMGSNHGDVVCTKRGQQRLRRVDCRLVARDSDQRTPLVFAHRSRRAWTYACHVINCIIRKDGSGGDARCLPARRVNEISVVVEMEARVCSICEALSVEVQLNTEDQCVQRAISVWHEWYK